MKPARPLLIDQVPEEWDLGNGPEYRRKQVAEWLFAKRADSIAAMTNLPAAIRQHLETTYDFTALKLAKLQGSHDTTRKLLWELRTGDYIESVLIPASLDLFGERSDRFTLCVSTQVGCAYGCKFCASGLEGWKRNLTAGEIVAQIIETERATKTKINNLVFMGMGEPLANYKNLMQALNIINAEWGRGHRRAAHHRFHQRTGPANSRAGRAAAANPAGAFAPRRDRRGAPADHAGKPQVSPRRAA